MLGFAVVFLIYVPRNLKGISTAERYVSTKGFFLLKVSFSSHWFSVTSLKASLMVTNANSNQIKSK